MPGSPHASSGSGPAPLETARRWVLTGVVQGVGFRPFVYRLAVRHGLRGRVSNNGGRVEILAAGDSASIEHFTRALIEEAPAIARPRIEQCTAVDAVDDSAFLIAESEGGADSDIHLPVDYFVCEDCLAELEDPDDRRYRYPFINCTQCGPRYTLIESLPYDRERTAMCGFALCERCLEQYRNPADRRFHAEPLACPECGPQLLFRQAQCSIDDPQAALQAAVQALNDGLLLAVKGVGGYHLMCDAGNAEAIARLRAGKPRPHKPLALMFLDVDAVRQALGPTSVSREDAELLCGPSRPIVLLPMAQPELFAGIAPGLGEVGVMLAYSPLHHLLLKEMARPLVATSANLGGEPVLTANHEVELRLPAVAEAFLHHNRPILRPADDSVYRRIGGRLRPLRLGRGIAPLELALPSRLEKPVLAVGAHSKNTLALGWGQRAVISPHIGDMGSLRSQEVFETLVEDLQSLYGVRAEVIVHDLHNAYSTSRWARQQSLPRLPVQHHTAHASALAGEFAEVENWLVFTWDGVGLGTDGHLWGGEGLYGGPGHWQRVSSFREFRLPGADKAGRQPWRSAAGMCWQAGIERGTPGGELLKQAWRRGLGAPFTSAVGRIFDAAAALTGICDQASFEGQAPMWLEARAASTAGAISLPLERDAAGIWRSDWQPLLGCLLDSTDSVEARAGCFHASLAQALVDQALAVRARQQVDAVGLCGGVFQNSRLTGRVIERLQASGFHVHLGRRVPMNDAGIGFGQLVEYAARQGRS